jgi:hypothetical protein
VQIVSPLPQLEWKVGDTIELDGSATDAKGNSISEPLGYYWNTKLAHCPVGPTACHEHPLQTFSGLKSAEFLAPEHDFPSYIRVDLRVADHRGLAGEATLNIYPHTRQLTIGSTPPGIELTAGLKQGPSPFPLTAIDGSNVVLSAPATAVVGGKTYTWQSWSDGGPRTHAVIANSDISYEAIYATSDGSGGEGSGPTPGPGSTPPATGPGPAVDRLAPATRLLSHPPAKTPKRTARFAFSSSEGDSGFRCKLDRGAFKPCVSPRSLKGLKLGPHTFKVVASDASGNADPSPASFSWKVTPPPRG